MKIKKLMKIIKPLPNNNKKSLIILLELVTNMIPYNSNIINLTLFTINKTVAVLSIQKWAKIHHCSKNLDLFIAIKLVGKDQAIWFQWDLHFNHLIILICTIMKV